jgi:hypothetical protein
MATRIVDWIVDTLSTISPNRTSSYDDNDGVLDFWVFKENKPLSL